MAKSDFPIDLIEKLFDAKIAVVTNQLDTVQGSINTLNHTLNGNGKPGLINRIETLETRERVRAGQFAVLAFVGSAALFIVDKLISPLYAKFIGLR